MLETTPIVEYQDLQAKLFQKEETFSGGRKGDGRKHKCRSKYCLQNNVEGGELDQIPFQKGDGYEKIVPCEDFG